MTKRLLQFLCLQLMGLSFAGTSWGQLVTTPKGILFQAAVTDNNGNSAANRTIYLQDLILKNSAGGTVVYSETFQVKASDQGLVSIVIGQGNRTAGVNGLGEIDWSSGPYFLNVKVAIAPSIPTVGWVASQNYVDMGTSMFWSVPYAMYAAKVEGMDQKLNIADTAAMLKSYAGNRVLFSAGNNGLVPAPGQVQGRVLSDNGSWVVIPRVDTAALINSIKQQLNTNTGGTNTGNGNNRTNSLDSANLYKLISQKLDYADTLYLSRR
ncbi:MAG: hypothetical protein KGO92_13640, partial [Bacteroidota bacterium]|nr:hypothetical protein [Bacteroidota bacterium]